jgi:hypothetical protein
MIDDGDYGAVGGMRIGRGKRSTRRKPAPVPLIYLGKNKIQWWAIVNTMEP